MAYAPYGWDEGKVEQCFPPEENTEVHLYLCTRAHALGKKKKKCRVITVSNVTACLEEHNIWCM